MEDVPFEIAIRTPLSIHIIADFDDENWSFWTSPSTAESSSIRESTIQRTMQLPQRSIAHC